MKKSKPRLTLKRETLRTLVPEELNAVHGGQQAGEKKDWLTRPSDFSKVSYCACLH